MPRYMLLFALVAVGCGEKRNPDAQANRPAATVDAGTPVLTKTEGESQEVWPTEEEVRSVVHAVEYGIRASETNKSVWKVKDCTHSFESIKFGNRTIRKQMTVGGPIETVFPVKVHYTRTTSYEHRAPVVEKAGGDTTAFFYRDSFGAWTCKFGND